MGIFICKNQDCPKFNVEVDIMTFNWPYTRQSEIIKQLTCECGHKREAKEFKSSNKAPAHAKFNSLSNDDKRKVLKKRAQDAYKRDGEAEKKLLKKREVINKMRNNYGI